MLLTQKAGSFCKQRGGIITVTAVREQGHDSLACVFRALSQLDRAVQGCAGGDSYGNAFLLGEELRRGKGVLIGCAEDLAVDLRVQDFRDKARADALDLVGAASALGEDRF